MPTVDSKVSQSGTGSSLDFHIVAPQEEQDGLQCIPPHLVNIYICKELFEAPAAEIPRSVISANVRLALRCRSIFSEYTRVLKASNGGPLKKSVSAR